MYGWRVLATTDCSMAPVTFLIESTAVGEQAYAEAHKIAEAIKAGQSND